MNHSRKKFNWCHKQGFYSAFIKCIVVLSAAVVLLLPIAELSADGQPRKIPGISREPTKYTLPEHLADLSTEEVTTLRAARQKDLDGVRNAKDSKESAEQYMFEQLMAHDKVRMSITDILPKLIDEYHIEGKFKKTLLGYRSTFAEEITDSRKNVENLDDYPSYDFRFTAVYMSMLFAFQEHPEVYARLKGDMHDENSTIGNYRKRLDDSYQKVAQAKEKMDVIYAAEDLEKIIYVLDEELARRN